MAYAIPQWMNHVRREDATVLKDHNRIIGMIHIAKHSDDNRYWVNLIAIDPDVQHQQLGSRLLETAEQRASKRYHANELHLHTEGHLGRNLHFYAKNGYHMRDVDAYGYLHTSAVHFSKRLG
jgi:GNAT superfamily N-acetyltransferase